jgi:hypothetical protein
MRIGYARASRPSDRDGIVKLFTFANLLSINYDTVPYDGRRSGVPAP